MLIALVTYAILGLPGTQRQQEEEVEELSFKLFENLCGNYVTIERKTVSGSSCLATS